MISLVGAVRASDAARSRIAARRLREAAAGDASLIGILVDVAERGTPVTIRTTGPRAVRGRIVMVGVDVVAVREAASLTYVPIQAVVMVSPPPSDQSSGDRPPARPISFAAVAGALAANRARVDISLAVGDPVRGQLRAAGRDVLTIRLDDAAPPRTALVVPAHITGMSVAAYEGGLASG